ncbi:MAG: SMI1/KNR4 family protein [Treponemataceae bacterium]|nr:SMI1/KNR4 family protein [Treponemataceae bacterium]
MKTAEQFKELLARYYQRDEETKKLYEEFTAYSYVPLNNLLDAMPRIEEKFNLKLPEEYKTFIEADSAWGMYGGEEDFRIYDENEIYEFNCIGKHTGNSSIEEMKDYFMFGQDGGECSYFFDPFNRLGYGIDAVWRINRCSCDKRDFELVAKDFYELVEKFCDKKDEDFERPFENEPEKYPYKGHVIEDVLERYIENNSDCFNAVKDIQIQVEKFIKILETKNISCQIHSIRYFDSEEPRNYIIPSVQNIPFEILYLIQKKMYSIFFSEWIFTTLCDEDLIVKNYGKKAAKPLKDMFVFASSNVSRFVGKNINAMDYFFVDPTNKLGNGSEAVYIICTKSKRLEEACYVAKDIVDLFRIFAEGEELNTTPIGKAK